MKKLILVAGLFCAFLSLHANSFDRPLNSDKSVSHAIERAQHHFKANFESASNINWYNDSRENIYCSFHQGNTTNRVFYDKRGHWLYTVMSYPGYDLPRKIKDQVNEYFKCYQISSVNEIRSHSNEPVYVINIENDDNIKIIKLIGEEIEVQQDLDKR